VTVTISKEGNKRRHPKRLISVTAAMQKVGEGKRIMDKA
jgi:hypothetical protein